MKKERIDTFLTEMRQSIKNGELSRASLDQWDYILNEVFDENPFQMEILISLIEMLNDKYITEDEFNELIKPIYEDDLFGFKAIDTVNKSLVEDNTYRDMQEKIEVLDMALSEMMMMAPQIMEGGE